MEIDYKMVCVMQSNLLCKLHRGDTFKCQVRKRAAKNSRLAHSNQHTHTNTSAGIMLAMPNENNVSVSDYRKVIPERSVHVLNRINQAIHACEGRIDKHYEIKIRA